MAHGRVMTASQANEGAGIVPTWRASAHHLISRVDDPEVRSLLPDDEGGAVLAVEHLVRLDRRRIASKRSSRWPKARDTVRRGSRDAGAGKT